jgi:putative transposase
MRFSFVAKHRGIWPVSWICGALGVSRSGFHAWLNRSPSRRAQYDEVLVAGIRSSFAGSDRTYGARRVWHDVLAEGLDAGLHRIERLMRQEGLRARPRRRGLPKDGGQRHAVSPNILDRAFVASAPNQKWIADFTYIWTAQGWLYVAAVVDLYSRRVVGWSMSSSMAAQLVTDALIMAIWRRGKPDSLLHHSDQGSQYTSEQFQRLMADHGITCSMSRSGNVWDNAAMESFFSSLKTERTARKVYRTRDDAKADVFDYIERFYNPRRRHSTLGYLSPVQYEEQAKQAQLRVHRTGSSSRFPITSGVRPRRTSDACSSSSRKGRASPSRLPTSTTCLSSGSRVLPSSRLGSRMARPSQTVISRGRTPIATPSRRPCAPPG